MKSNSKPTKFSETIQTATFLVGPLMLSRDLPFMFVDEPYSNMKSIFFIIKKPLICTSAILLIETIIYLSMGDKCWIFTSTTIINFKYQGKSSAKI